MGDTSGQQRAHKGDGSASVPVEYLAHLVDIAGRFHVRPEQLLRGTGITTQLERGLPVPRQSFVAVVSAPSS